MLFGGREDASIEAMRNCHCFCCWPFADAVKDTIIWCQAFTAREQDPPKEEH